MTVQCSLYCVTFILNDTVLSVSTACIESKFFSQDTNTTLQLTCRDALRALKDNGFLTTSHWHQLGSDLGVSLDERRRLREQALIAQNYDVALEECLDIWIRNSKEASWDVLIQAVERLEIATADRMRQTIQIIS